MSKTDKIERRISTAFGRNIPDLILKNAHILNVFTGEFEDADIAICDGYIAGIGDYANIAENLRNDSKAAECGEECRIIDLQGRTVCPGLIDGHIHLESSMISPEEFAKAVVPHGTTAVITDPHEITNVAGEDGLRFMLERTAKLPLDVFFMLPSCVPATDKDESGAVLEAENLEPFFGNERVLGLAELMNAFGTVRNDPSILAKIRAAAKYNKVIDGHAPGLTGCELNAYVSAGVSSDHECSTAEEAIEKVRRGQWIMVREGTAAHNLQALLPLFGENYYSRCLLVTDDKHPGDLIEFGHIDYIIREAIKLGADPVRATVMASHNAAVYFGLKDMGAVAPGYKADLVVLSDFESFEIESVIKAGEIVAGKYTGNQAADAFGLAAGSEFGCSDTDSMKQKYPRIYDSFNLKELTTEDFKIGLKGDKKRVIGLVKGELLTKELIVPNDSASESDTDISNDIIKLAVIERHKNTGHIGLSYVSGYGLKKGAVASSIAHDSHNLIVIGTNDADMALAANTVRSNHGGLAVVCDGKVLGELALPIAGLMCDEDASFVEKRLTELKKLARNLGVSEGIDPFMTLAFVSLPVIPALKLTTFGLVDVATQQIVPSIF